MEDLDEEFEKEAAISTMNEIKRAMEEFRSGCNESIEDGILEMPLAVEYREEWHKYGEKADIEFNIEMSTGGPAVRIRGKMDDDGVESAKIQYNNWFKPWKDLPLNDDDKNILVEFCQLIVVMP